jgi:hypothetical protein
MTILAGIVLLILLCFELPELVHEIREHNRKDKPSNLSEMYKIERQVDTENSIDNHWE